MQSSSKTLIFDIDSEYGHFRKFNTTSSPLTYSIPTRPALIGILGAILGIERETGPNIFTHTPLCEIFTKNNSKIAVQLLAKVNKTYQGFNLRNVPTTGYQNVKINQIEFELLKNPKFRIFIQHSNKDIFEELNTRIKSKRHHFTPYLGLSQFTSDINWVDLVDSEKIKTTELIEINSVINLSKINSDNIQLKKAHYTTDTMPLYVRRDRVVEEYANILLERNGDSILLKPDIYWKTKYGNIVFL